MTAPDFVRAQPILAEAARRWRGRPVTILRGAADAPYKWLGLAVCVLQRQRVKVRLGFISELPPGRD